MPSHRFKKGDIIRLVNGSAKAMVEWVGSHEIGYRYLSDRTCSAPLRYREPAGLVLLCAADDDNPKFQKIYQPLIQEANMATTPSQGDLFVTKEETPRYGTYVGQHGNKIVIAMKDDKGAIEAFEDDAISEVRPFTVSVKGLHSGSQIHLQVNEGSVVKDDVLVYAGQLVLVTAIDTKCRNPVQFKGRKVVLEEV